MKAGSDAQQLRRPDGNQMGTFLLKFAWQGRVCFQDSTGRDRPRRISGSAASGRFPNSLRPRGRAGVVRYDVDFAARTVAYLGATDERYVEEYPAVDVN